MKILLASLLLVISVPAMALDVPQRAYADTRIQHVAYDENQVVAIYASQGVATLIVFAPGEEVLDIASGFSDGWEFHNRRNNLYLKPKAFVASDGVAQGILSPKPGRWDTNLLVTTNLRTYAFQLTLIGPRSPGAKLNADPRMAFRVQFTYPADALAARNAAAANERTKERMAAVNSVRNTNYTRQVGKRSAAIAPTSAYDDGTYTYLTFPNNREIPAVFLVASDKTESIVNTHFKDDVLVIHRVAREMVLRLGKQVVSVFNESFDADGVKPINGTTVPGVDRVLIQQESTP